MRWPGLGWIFLSLSILALVCLSTSAHAEDTPGDVRVQIVVYALRDHGNETAIHIAPSSMDLSESRNVIDEVLGLVYDTYFSREPYLGTRMQVWVNSSILMNGSWVPNRDAQVRLFISSPLLPDPTQPVVNRDGTVLNWTLTTNSSGQGSLEMVFPDVRGAYRVRGEVDTGEGPVALESPLLVAKGAPPEMEVEYVLYTMRNVTAGDKVVILGHTFGDIAGAYEYLKGKVPVPEKAVEGDAYKNSTVSLVFSLFEEDMSDPTELVPAKDREINISMRGWPYSYDSPPVTTNDGLPCVWLATTDVGGSCSLETRLPDFYGTISLYFVDVDRSWAVPIKNDKSTLTIGIHPIILIKGLRLSPDEIRVGEPVNISGRVVYLYTGMPVEGVEVFIAGAYITSMRGMTDRDGLFRFTFQAPLLPISNVSLSVRALDPSTDELAECEMAYKVLELPQEGGEGDDAAAIGVPFLIAIFVVGAIVIVVGVLIIRI